MTTPQDEDKPESIESAIQRIRELRQGEARLMNFARQKELEATLIAFDVGICIMEQVNAGGSPARRRIASECGFSVQTTYDYEHLVRGATDKSEIQKYTNLPRDYFRLIGSSIMRSNDLLGLLIRHNLLVLPLWSDSGSDGQKRKPDSDRISEVGNLLAESRKQIAGLGISYAYDDYEAVLVGGHVEYNIACNPEDESKLFQSQRVVRDLFADISALTGWGDRIGLNVDELAKDHPDELPPDDAGVKVGDSKVAIKFKRQRQKQIEKGATPPSGDNLPLDKKLFHGRAEQILLNADLFPARSIDVVITDPPYSDEYFKGKAWRDYTDVEHDAEETIRQQANLVGNIAHILAERQIIKPQFVWFCFVPMDFVHVFFPPILEAFKGLDFTHQVLVWDKKNSSTPVGGHQTFSRRAEAILYVNVGNKALNFTEPAGERKFMHPNILECAAAKNQTASPFWKPPELLERLIMLATYDKNSSGQVILDPFAGSGSTGVAARKLGRDFRLIESHDGQFKICQASIPAPAT